MCGFTVGVTADRRSDEQTLMLTRLGVDVIRGPSIRTLPLGDDVRLRALTEKLIADPPDYLVANTGLGMRSWLGLAATWGLDEALRDAFVETRIAARGPKAAAAVGIAGLGVWWRAGSEQLASVGARLLEEPIAGKRVAVQLHRDDRLDLLRTLSDAGAEVVGVPVYRWTLPEDRDPALRLVGMCCEGGVDAVTFTAAPALRNFVRLAEVAGRSGPLLEALNGGMTVACVGPVCAAAAVDEGIAGPVFPDLWRLGSLVRLVSEMLLVRRRQYRIGGVDLLLQGSVAVVGGAPVRLTDLEAAVLSKLASRPGATVTRQALLRDVWDDPRVDPHVLETAVGRLRAKLGPAGAGIETAVRRGYRLNAAATPPRPDLSRS